MRPGPLNRSIANIFSVIINDRLELGLAIYENFIANEIVVRSFMIVFTIYWLSGTLGGTD